MVRQWLVICKHSQATPRKRQRLSIYYLRGIGHNQVATPKPKTPEELGGPPGYFEKTYGSITDEAFKRYPQGEFEKREPLD